MEKNTLALATVSLTIDGKKVKAEAGLTILEAVAEAGIEIPTMCHDKRIEPIGSCRMCVVEVAGEDDLMASCSTIADEGMVVSTDTEELKAVRRLILELIFSDHDAYCLPPCQYECPAHLDIPGYVKAVEEGDSAKCIRIIKDRLPFPRVLGRVCPRPCEDVCRRGDNDEPVAICDIKRFAGDEASGEETLPFSKAEPTGKRVAVIGAGPAGLTNAYYLALKGHSVTVFESLPEPGGMLRYGIPPYRLPPAVLDEELEELWSLGVELKTNVTAGEDFTLESLLEDDGYDAVFLGIGAHDSRPLNVEGDELEGVMSVVDFLRCVALGKPADMGQKVAVIGGGFSAMDAARASLRLGAKEVTVIYRRTRHEMPAHEHEINSSDDEGVKLLELAAPVKVLGKGGHVSGLVCQKMELGEPDESGRRSPEPVEGSEFELDIDMVIPAIGQFPLLTFLDEETGQEYPLFPDESGVTIHDYWHSIEADPVTMQTGRPEVFAAGDGVTGAATVIKAVGGARRAAFAMHDFLTGCDMEMTKERLTEEEPVFLDIKQEPEVEAGRSRMPALSPEERRGDFSEVELGFPSDTAQLEASRCLQCVCPAEPVCNLRRKGVGHSVEENRFRGRMHPVLPLDDGNPVILRDYDKCILCSACARICDEVVGAQAVELSGSGMDTFVACAYNRGLADTDCIFCGQCVSVCPTGALDNKMSLPERMLPFRSEAEELKKVNTTCSYCGVGCSLTLHVKDNRIVEVTSDDPYGVNDGNLCVKGRYGFDFINHADRLTTPLIRKNGELVAASWDEALNEVSSHLASIRDRHGGEAIGAFASARCTNEDDFILQKFLRTVFKSNNIDHCARL